MKIIKKLNKKGAVSIISFIFYIMISIAVLSIVALGANDIIKSQKENYNYNEMIQNINKIENKLTQVKHTKNKTIDFKIYNPQEIIIDCENNQIYGKLHLSKDIGFDNNKIVNGVTIFKDQTGLGFIKKIENNNTNLTCPNLHPKHN